MIGDGPTTTTTIFEFIAQPPFLTFGVRLDVASSALLHSGAQRKRKELSSAVSSSAVLVRHQMQNSFENYGGSCGWADPEASVC